MNFSYNFDKSRDYILTLHISVFFLFIILEKKMINTIIINSHNKEILIFSN